MIYPSGLLMTDWSTPNYRLHEIWLTGSKGSGGADELTFYISDLNGSYPEFFPARNE
jgi:hypothetical protein